MISLQAAKEEGFRNQALECFEALKKKVDGLETKAKHEEEFRYTMMTKTKQSAEREDEFRRLVYVCIFCSFILAQLNKMQESIDNMHRKKATAVGTQADSEHKADEKTEP
ncbi:hypothetical protein DPMN_078283 [Dreissena polymorpha]|uniref:Uncharacterized protein n=1 Tax=Dreissena polymorpha TaxID=45954 RepID=A0A9D3YLZ5_DREPO|nr:hypothetical protein DPMN_078283 [Dreissena polymorpha]